MAEPKVSIIVPVYNVEKYLKRCITSLRNQSLVDIEVILVDDASTDSSLQICEEAAREDSRIKVIHKENEGAGMARNAALKIATGKYIGFVDSDDFVEADMFQILYEKAEQYQSDLILSGVIYVDGNVFAKEGERVQKCYFENDTHFETKEQREELCAGIVGSLPEDAEDSKYGMGIWKNLFRHEVIKEHQLLFQSEREIFSEDSLFMMDYIACIRKATGIKEAFYNYCRNEASISKAYKADRFEKTLCFAEEVLKRLGREQIYFARFWQAMCRVTCSQEIMHATGQRVSYKQLKGKLKEICTHPLTRRSLKGYPIQKLPFRQRVFAYGMKYRSYILLKILVGLRSR